MRSIFSCSPSCSVPVAHDFQRTIPQVAFAITLTLMMRPIGAFIFGLLGDQFGRRIPLMADIIFYSVMELLTAFAPNFTIFLVAARALRNRHGRRMGTGRVARDGIVADRSARIVLGNSATGLCVRLSPRRARLLDCVSVFRMARAFHCRRAAGAAGDLHSRARAGITGLGAGPAANANARELDIVGLVRQHGLLFIYAALLMTAFNYMSHGTQDLYPTFLEKQRGFGVSAKSTITIVYAFGAICGGTIVGFFSQRWGRRRCIILCGLCGIVLIPLWIFAPTTALLIVGGFLMQFMVQGAWGVVPVHLNELSPPEYRGTFPGLAYQLGNFAAAYAAQQQAWLAATFSRRQRSCELCADDGVRSKLAGFVCALSFSPRSDGKRAESNSSDSSNRAAAALAAKWY